MNSFKLESATAKNNLDDFGTLGIVLENQKMHGVRKDPYLYHTCNCLLCNSMRLAKPLPYAEPRVLTSELITQFKDLMLNKNFYKKHLKVILENLSVELEQTRCGGAVSTDYIYNLQQENCDNQTRNKIRHDLDFRQYL